MRSVPVLGLRRRRWSTAYKRAGKVLTTLSPEECLMRDVFLIKRMLSPALCEVTGSGIVKKDGEDREGSLSGAVPVPYV